ncbi:MAG: hypothetical protein ACI8S6_002765 [Myxococcota bacterium]|jgi:hypothetical protein
MIVDSMKLTAAALSACRGLLDCRRAWLADAGRALDIADPTGTIRVELDLTPGPLLQRHLSGPPGRRSDGPWTPEEQHILALLRLGIAQLEALETSGDGRALSQVAALLEPLPGALRGGRRRFDSRIFRQHIRSLSLPWHLLLPEFQQLLQDNAATRQPLPDRR